MSSINLQTEAGTRSQGSFYHFRLDRNLRFWVMTLSSLNTLQQIHIPYFTTEFNSIPWIWLIYIYIYEFLCVMISCKNSGVPRFQMPEKLSTGANGQKVDAASFFCQCSFDELSWLSVQFWSSCHRMPVTLVALLRTQEFARPGRLGVVAWVGLGSDRAAWSSSDSLIEKILLILSHRRQVWGILTFPSPQCLDPATRRGWDRSHGPRMSVELPGAGPAVTVRVSPGPGQAIRLLQFVPVQSCLRFRVAGLRATWLRQHRCLC